jgi:hypothetical protein
MSDDNLPSLDEINAARASQQARTVSVASLIEMKAQAKQLAREILIQASGAAVSGVVPLPDTIIDTISETLMNHAVSFLAGLGED